jgi:hypothetical protein
MLWQKTVKFFSIVRPGKTAQDFSRGHTECGQKKFLLRQLLKKKCAPNGYSDGNPGKFGMVTGPIQKGLTPLFLEFASRIQAGKIKVGKINKSVCKNFFLKPTTLTCKTCMTFFKINREGREVF